MRIVYVGTGEIGVPSLEALCDSGEIEVVGVVSQPDRPAGRSQKLLASPVKEVALRRHLQIFQPESINQDSSLEQLRFMNPDLLVVCAYGQILKKPVLDLPGEGCLNIHASLLPRYRGAACIQGAIQNGDVESGVTIMWMDVGMDTGDILLQRKLPILQTDTAGLYHDKLAKDAPAGLLEALRLIRDGEAPRIPQDNETATYVKKLKKEDGLIDWSESCNKIDWHIRAMTPWPSAFTTFDWQEKKRMLKVHRALPESAVSGEAGCILEMSDDGILVGAGKGSIRVLELQMEGRKRLDAATFLRGFSLEPGTRFGSSD